MNNKKGVKLLATLMVFAMAFAGVAVVLSDSEADAANYPETTAIDMTKVITLSADATGTGYVYVASTKTLTLDGYNGSKGFYSTTDLNIVIKGTNTISFDRAGNNTPTAAICSGGDLSITDDTNPATVDKLVISVSGLSTQDQTAYYANTFGIYSAGTLAISNIEVQITVGENDKWAWGVYGDGATTQITNVTGTIQAGNRAIQVDGGVACTITESELTLVGGEKAIQASETSTSLSLVKSKLDLKVLNNNFNQGENDVFALKVREASIDADSSIVSEGIHVCKTAGSNGFVNNGKVTVVSYTGGSANYNTGFTIDGDQKLTIGATGSITIDNGAKMTINLTTPAYFVNNGKIVNKGTIVDNKGVTFGTVEGIVPAATVSSGKLTLNNYNGSDVFDGSYTEVILVGNNTITLKDKDKAVTLGTTGKIYSVDGTGSLKIIMDVTKSTGNVIAISGTAITIDGITLDIEITAGANPTYSTVTGIKATGDVKTFAADIGIIACVSDYKNTSNVTGIYAVNNKVELKNTDLEVSAGFFGIAVKELEVSDSDVTASASKNAIKASTSITATIGSIIEAEAFGYDGTKAENAIMTGNLVTASDSVVTASGMMVITGKNNATVINKGNMVIRGTYENNGSFVNDGVVSVQGAIQNVAGTITNNGQITISNVANIDPWTDVSLGTLTAKTGTSPEAIVSGITIKSAIILADGTALVNLNISLKKGASDAITIEGIPGIAVLDGKNLKTMTASFTVANGKGTVSVAAAGTGANKVWQVTTAGSYKFDGTTATNISSVSTVAYADKAIVTDSSASLSVTGGELVNDGELIINQTSSNLVSGGKITNNGEMYVNKAIGVINGTLAGDFKVSTEAGEVTITIGEKGVLDSTIVYDGTYTPEPTASVTNPAPVAFSNEIDVSVVGKGTSTIKASVETYKPGFFTLTGLNSLGDDSKMTASVGKIKVDGETIGEKVILEVLAGTTLDTSGTISVNGVIAAQDGSTINMMVDGEPLTYVYGTLSYVISFEKDGYTYYCNLSYALANVEEGMTLTVGSSAVIADDVVVKKDVTLIVSANKTVTINKEKTLTMGEGASIVLSKGASVIIGTEGKEATITGTIVYKENEIAFNAAKVLGTIGTQDASSTLVEAVKLTTVSIKDGSIEAVAGNTAGALTIAVDGTKMGSLVIDKDASTYLTYVDVAKAVTTVNGTMVVGADTQINGTVKGDGAIVIKDGYTLTFQDKAVADIMIGNGTSGFEMSEVSAVDITEENPASATFKVKAVAATSTKAAYVALSGTVFAGEIVAVSNTAMDGLDVKKDAEISVPADATITVIGKSYATGLVKVAGTINMKVADDTTTAVYGELVYEITYDDADYTVYTYFATGVSNASAGDSFTVDQNLPINQNMDIPSGVTVTIAEDAVLNVAEGVHITIGTAKTTIGATTSVTGKIVLANTAFVVVYNDSTVDLANAKIVTGTGANEKDAKNSQFTVLNEVYATVFVGTATTNSSVANVVKPVIDGYRFVQWLDVNGNAMVGTSTTSNDNGVGNIDFDAKMNPSKVQVTFTKVEGISYYVNNLKQNTVGAPVYIAYGSTVTAVADYGYTGDALVNGKAYITIDNTTTTITGSGVSPASAPETSSDSGMGITDYLLIVLVVLAAILVVVVAIRMMRS